MKTIVNDQPTPAAQIDDAAPAQESTRRLTPGLHVASMVKGRAQWNLDRWKSMLPVVEEFENQYKSLTDAQLRKESLSLRYRARPARRWRVY